MKLLLIVATTIAAVGIIFVFSQELRENPEKIKVMNEETRVDQEVVDSEMLDVIDLKIREGFSARDEIVDYVMDIIEDDGTVNDIRVRIAMETDRRLEEHIKHQALWPKVTDCDRIDAAFAELEGKGIVARQNFSCCQTCGNAEIGTEIETFSKTAKPRGYAYYHMQDTENAATDGGLYLAYGSVRDTGIDTITVGETIRSVLVKHGLTVDWNGAPNRRICIVDLDWKKRIQLE